MKNNIKIIPERQYGFWLESIKEYDIECLRRWKNYHRKNFFFKDTISEEQQKSWFLRYCRWEDDYIFIIRDYNQNKVGCLGFRLRNDYIDIYNVIRGREDIHSVSIYKAMYVMLTYILKNYNNPIKCDVLKNNPAVKWYKKCGFDVLEEREYYIMGIEKNRIPSIKILVEEDEL